MNSALKKLDSEGFAIEENVLSRADINFLITTLKGGSKAGTRNLFAISEIRSLACSTMIRKLMENLLGKECFAVRAIFFDKSPEANWKVTWHQDLTIAVKAQKEIPGYGPWSIKDDIPHVQPPNCVLEQMLTIRIHLDDCNSENGPLRVISGSHQHGKLSSEQIQDVQSKIPETTCLIPRGGALLMRPLILHASSKANLPSHRRVIHLEFAISELDSNLEWYEKIF
jgi:ectoine hydroxylase-related dioxygenase (phytanoyl-CoA dioxygenase family)